MFSRVFKGAFGLFMLAIAATAGGAGLIMNVDFATVEGMALTYIVVFALADICELSIPILAGAIGWSAGLRVTFGVCVLTSMLCIVSTLADNQYGKLGRIDGASGAYQDALKAKTRAEATLAGIHETGSVPDLTAMVNDAVRAKEAECTQRGPRCRDKEAAVQPLRDRLSNATARDDAKAQLNKAVTDTAKGEPALPGLALAIADGTGANAHSAARGNALAKSIIPLLLIKCLVWFLPASAIRLMGSAFARREEEAKAEEAEAPAPIQALSRPHLVSSEAMPFGNVAEIVSANIEAAPGRARASIAELHAIYVRVCSETGRRPVPNGEFATAITAFCQAQGIATKQGDGDFFMLKKRIRETQKQGAR